MLLTSTSAVDGFVSNHTDLHLKASLAGWRPCVGPVSATTSCAQAVTRVAALDGYRVQI